MHKKIILLTGFFISLILQMKSQNTFVTDSLDIYITREMQRWNIPGVAVAVVKDGKVIASKGYGITNLDTKNKVDENTLFMIASNTKAFTATALSLLNSEGKLSLDDKVSKYMPAFKLYDDCATQMVTIRDLLSHRIGMETFQGDFLNWDSNLSRKEIINAIQLNKPTYDFRTTWGYSNAAFVTAGEIIPVVTDTSWDNFIKYRFFIPLDMKRSSTTYEAISTDKNACFPYTLWNGKLVKLNYDNINNLAPCASINSSVKDISNWLLMQLNNGVYNGKQIFPSAVLEETRIPNSIVSNGSSGIFKSQHFNLYGLGLGITDYEGRKIISHTGGADGFLTSVLFVPEENLGIIVLTNTDANYFFEACTYQILESYLGVPYRNLSSMFYTFYSANDKKVNEEIQAWYNTASKKPVPALKLKDYTGTYENAVYGKMEIKLEDGKLNMYFSHHPQLIGSLQALGENNFVCTYSPVTWGVKEIPFTVKDGKVISVTVTVNNFIDFGSYEFKKL